MRPMSWNAHTSALPRVVCALCSDSEWMTHRIIPHWRLISLPLSFERKWNRGVKKVPINMQNLLFPAKNTIFDHPLYSVFLAHSSRRYTFLAWESHGRVKMACQSQQSSDTEDGILLFPPPHFYVQAGSHHKHCQRGWYHEACSWLRPRGNDRHDHEGTQKRKLRDDHGLRNIPRQQACCSHGCQPEESSAENFDPGYEGSVLQGRQDTQGRCSIISHFNSEKAPVMNEGFFVVTYSQFSILNSELPCAIVQSSHGSSLRSIGSRSSPRPSATAAWSDCCEHGRRHDACGHRVG